MDYESMSLEELEELAFDGDEEAVEAYLRKAKSQFSDQDEDAEYAEYEEETADDEPTVIRHPEETTAATDTAASTDTGTEAQEESAAGVSAGQESDGYISSIQSMPLFEIKEKAYEGDPYALFQYGLIQSRLESEAETHSGIANMKQAVDKLKDEMRQEKISATSFTELVREYAERCKYCYYKYYASSDADFYAENFYNAAVLVNEMDTSAPDLLIECYSNGIGCEENMDTVLKLKGVKASKNGCIGCADLATEFIIRGMTMETAEWSQKALASSDSAKYPKLCSALRMWLGANGYTDEKGAEIDPVIESEKYKDFVYKPGEDEALCLFRLADSDEEKLHMAEFCKEALEVKSFISSYKAREKEKRLEEERLKQEEIRKRMEEEQRREAAAQEELRRQQDLEKERRAREQEEKKKQEVLERIANMADSPAGYYEEMCRLPLIALKEKADDGDPYAEFVYGKTGFELASADSERQNGLRQMNEALDLLTRALLERNATDLIAEMESIYANKCIEECSILQKQGDTESVAAYAKTAFEMYSNAYELDPERVDRLIWCYERGIGCKKSKDQALKLMAKKAERGGIIECADLVCEYKELGMTVETALWSQRALTCSDVNEHAKLAAYLRIMLSENGFQDEKGAEIDPEAEKAICDDDSIIPDSKEAYRLFRLMTDPDDKLKYARLSSKHSDAKKYIAIREKELDRLKNKKLNEEKRAARAQELAAEREKLQKQVGEKIDNIKATGKAVSESNNTTKALMGIIVILAIVCLVILGKVFSAVQGSMGTTFIAAVAVLIIALILLKRRKKD